MSLDVYAKMVVAIPVSKFARIENRQTEVTRYDTYTGKPYPETVDKYFLVIGDKRVPVATGETVKEVRNYLGDNYTHENEKLGVFSSTHYNDADESYIGILVGKGSRSHQSVSDVSARANLAQVHDTFDLCVKFLREYGIDDEPQVVSLAEMS